MSYVLARCARGKIKANNMADIEEEIWLRNVESSVRIKNIMGYLAIADRRTLVSIWSQDRKRSQTIAEDRTWFYLLRSSAIVCDHDRRIAGDRRSLFPYDRRRSQNFLRSAICDPRSSAIIWKPALREHFVVLPDVTSPSSLMTSPPARCHSQLSSFVWQHFLNISSKASWPTLLMIRMIDICQEVTQSFQRKVVRRCEFKIRTF